MEREREPAGRVHYSSRLRGLEIAMQLHTIGHSTRSSDELAALLAEHGIELLADVRRYPGSKRYPHFSSEAMGRWLPEHGVAYLHMPELGGRRKPLADSPNTAW